MEYILKFFTVKCNTEEINPKLDELLKKLLPTWRLEQGVSEVFVENFIDRKLYGKYLEWINRDIIKEESDIIKQSGFKMNEIRKDIHRIAIHFIKNI
tara:strand:- start:405 stop:695 length:291 start_codon:yes stop_codon:yes gene_type:complete